MILIEKSNGILFELEYHYGNYIHNLSTKKSVASFIESRVMILALSAFEIMASLYDLCYMTVHSLLALGYSISHFKSPLKYCSTTRNIAVNIVEFVRHIFASLCGSIVGIVSAKFAVEWFMPPNQIVMETRKGNMTSEQASRLYEMTGFVHNLFEKYHIPYCMTGGTQLGAARHEGLIPWDDDVDLFVKVSQKNKIHALSKELKDANIEMIECHLGLKFFDSNGSNVEESNLEYKYPFIDICFIDRDSKGHLTYISEHFKKNYAGEYLTEVEWEQRKLQKFGPLMLYGAPEPEKFCKRMYGTNVFQYGYQILNHRSFKLEIPRKYYLEKNANGKCRSAATVIA